MFSLYLAPGPQATLIRMWHSTDVTLKPYPRGFHLITRKVVAALPELASIQMGLLRVFIRHTSASLTLGENASPDVRRDFGGSCALIWESRVRVSPSRTRLQRS